MELRELLEAAKKDIGVHEIKGNKDNPRIVEMHSHTTLNADDDETAWCASAANCWLEENGFECTHSAAAKSFATYGEPLEKGEPGCIVVLKRRKEGPDSSTGSTSGYHVGLFDKEAEGHIYLVGGNQSDQVKISGFSLKKYDVVAYRKPIIKETV